MYPITSDSFLSEEFLKQYEGVRPKNAGVLFEVTYLSKYSRWREDKKRREYWNEIIQRVVEYNVSLYSGHKGRDYLIQEAEHMYEMLFHLYTYPAGRTYWIGGTEAANKWAESNYNCSAVVLDELEDFCDLFHLLMLGCGVGYRILKEDVAKFPKLITNFKVQHVDYEYINAGFNGERTEIKRSSGSDYYTIRVGDSKEGWVSALRCFLNELVSEPIFSKEKIFTFNYNWVRPAGARINTFGGRAAGPKGLEIMFSKLEKIIKDCNGTLTPVACMDLANIIAENVLVGGVRRSAQIALGSPDDQEFIDAKLDLFSKPELKHRRKSNNTIVLKERPSREKIKEILQRVKESWEPGFLNFESLQKRRAWAEAVNPCSEAILGDRGVCNLSGSFLTSFVKGESFDWELLEKSHRLATRIALRITNVSWSLPRWEEVAKRDRLLGVSFTGLMDALDQLGWDHESFQAIDLYEKLDFWANDEADKYAFEMRVPRPIAVTLLKPEGSVSLLATSTSCGMHRSYAPHYIRRYKVSNLDPLCKALKTLEVPNEADMISPERTVFSFYVSSGAKIAANDEPATSQYKRYLNIMRKYCDQNVSCTLTVGPGEWELMEEMIYDNWDDTVAIALANKDMSENVNYVQLPYEAIAEDQLKPNPDLSKLFDFLTAFENEEYEDTEIDVNTTSLECSSSGSCPIR